MSIQSDVLAKIRKQDERDVKAGKLKSFEAALAARPAILAELQRQCDLRGIVLKESAGNVIVAKALQCWRQTSGSMKAAIDVIKWEVRLIAEQEKGKPLTRKYRTEREVIVSPLIVAMPKNLPIERVPIISARAEQVPTDNFVGLLRIGTLDDIGRDNLDALNAYAIGIRCSMFADADGVYYVRLPRRYDRDGIRRAIDGIIGRTRKPSARKSAPEATSVHRAGVVLDTTRPNMLDVDGRGPCEHKRKRVDGSCCDCSYRSK